ncbi:MAG: MBL fold metallo-hydrolase RNA specificity domain-containing protein [Bacilli bacterium]
MDKFDLTSHADREEILNFVLEKDPRTVILTHGLTSPASGLWIKYWISPKTSVIIPEPSETIEF